jgi:signal transduction histidine kinase
MTVRARLVITIGGMTLLLLIPLVFSVGRLSELREIALEQRGSHGAAFVALGRLQTAIAELDRFIRSYVATLDPELREAVAGSLREAHQRLTELQAAGYEETSAGVAVRIDSLESRLLEIAQLVDGGRPEQATALLEQSLPMLQELRAALDEVARAIDRRSLRRAIEAQQISEPAVRTTYAAAAIAIVLAMLWGLWTTRALTTPLHRLRQATADVADGEFAAPLDLPYQRADEIGDLSRSFRAMAEQLAELERLRAEFISVITHDLKTPLNVIGGYAALLQEGVYGRPADAQREVLGRIQEQTESLNRLVEQLLNMGRLEAGGFPLQLDAIEPAEFFHALERTFQALAELHHIDFTVDAASTLPPIFWADGDRLRDQVLGNLLSNAFKFTPDHGRITVRAWGDEEAGTIRIEVADNGPGIPPELLPNIFEKFYQLTGEARAKGTGLGLAIARDLVQAHGGSITVRSEPGEGACFHIILPVHPQRTPASPQIAH